VSKELRDWYAKHGICAECGRESAAPHRKYCWECLYKRNERHHKYIANMSEERSKRKEKKLVKELKRNMLSGKLPENVYVAEKSQQNPEKLCVRCV
jgi:ribosomal protein L37E